MHITFLQSLLLLAAGSAGAAAAPVGTIVKIVAGKYSVVSVPLNKWLL